MISIFIFILITLFLINRLAEILGLHIGYKIEVNNDVFSDKSEIKEVKVHNCGIEEKICQVSKNYEKFDAVDFINKAKKVFELLFESYANGNKRILKDLLAPKIYNAFLMAINDRNSRGEILEGILVRFIKAEIVDAIVTDDDIFVTVQFITEQSNVLKSRNGTVLEGNSDFIEKRTDIWVFERKKHANDLRWFLYEIKDQQ